MKERERTIQQDLSHDLSRKSGAKAQLPNATCCEWATQRPPRAEFSALKLHAVASPTCAHAHVHNVNLRPKSYVSLDEIVI